MEVSSIRRPILLAVLEVNGLVNMVSEGLCVGGADLILVGGLERTLRWCFTSATQWSASGGGYQLVQPLAWLNLPGSECCFLRMFMQPSSLLLWNVLLWSPSCVCACVRV